MQTRKPRTQDPPNLPKPALCIHKTILITKLCRSCFFLLRPIRTVAPHQAAQRRRVIHCPVTKSGFGSGNSLLLDTDRVVVTFNASPGSLCVISGPNGAFVERIRVCEP